MTPQIVERRLTYMTREWKKAFQLTAHLADSLNLEMAIAGSPGWSESGGACRITSYNVCYTKLLRSLKYDSARKMVFRALKTLREQLENDRQLMLLCVYFQ